MTVDRKTLEIFEVLELNGELTHREQQLMEICKQLREENADRFIELAEMAHRIGHARSRCRKDHGIMCELYEIKIEEGGET